MKTIRFNWISEKEELWVYVCERKKSGVRYRFGKHYDNSKDGLKFPCNFCTLKREQCKTTKNPLFPDDPYRDFAEFCAEITIENTEIQKKFPLNTIEFVYLGH